MFQVKMGNVNCDLLVEVEYDMASSLNAASALLLCSLLYNHIQFVDAASERSRKTSNDLAAWLFENSTRKKSWRESCEFDL